jgi:glycosyltransferase involved in cell wall biosynthesis
MKLIFLSNFINHHQVPLADEFYHHLGDNYKFITTVDIPESFKKAGYPEYQKKEYLFNAYTSKDNEEKAIQLINEADVVITGSAPQRYVRQRLKKNDLTFMYGERWLKTKSRIIDFPRKKYQHRFNKKSNVYYLAASAYVPNDMKLLAAYANKIFKWGYFPAVKEIDIQKNLVVKRNQKIRMIWCARYINWKRPEMVPVLAKYLKEKGYEFEIDMVGSGVLLPKIEKMIRQYNLEGYVNIIGNKPNNEVLKMMRESHIFIFTSDRGEGWGAVLNEAMSSGCTVVASHEIGAVPFLLKDKENGMIFESKNNASLANKVEYLILNEGKRERMAIEAYKTIKDVWSPGNAAKQFIRLSKSFLNNEQVEIENGPCSNAHIQK